MASSMRSTGARLGSPWHQSGTPSQGPKYCVKSDFENSHGSSRTIRRHSEGSTIRTPSFDKALRQELSKKKFSPERSSSVGSTSSSPRKGSTFGSSPRFKPMENHGAVIVSAGSSPGPGHFTPRGSRLERSQSFQHSTHKLEQFWDMPKSPGPAQYQRAGHPEGNRGVISTTSPRFQPITEKGGAMIVGERSKLGPGSHSPQTSNDQFSQSFQRGNHKLEQFWDMPKSPGPKYSQPGTNTETSANFKASRSARFSSSTTPSPGPGAYEVERSKKFIEHQGEWT